MNQKILLIVMALAASINSLAQKIRFRGEAAKNIFVCDFFSGFDCWFALGNNYCEIETEDFLKFENKMLLEVHGTLAAKINKITRDCSDNDALAPFYYNRGVFCYPDRTFEYHCVLSIDHWWFIKDQKSASRRTKPRIYKTKKERLLKRSSDSTDVKSTII